MIKRRSRTLARRLAITTLAAASCMQQAQAEDLPCSEVAPAEGQLLCEDVKYLAHDDRGGRVTQSTGWWDAHTYVHDAMVRANIEHDYHIIAQGLPGLPSGGTNLFGRIDGSDPARRNEYILIGAHLDHVAGCTVKTDAEGQTDQICNGATDNATGVAVVLEIARRLSQQPAPARSVVFAFWDREEIDMVGSAEFRIDALPSRTPYSWPQQLVTYINYDIQGANLLSELGSTTFAIGARSGDSLLDAVNAAAASAAPGLTLRHLTETLGEYRSDYANFIAPAAVYNAWRYQREEEFRAEFGRRFDGLPNAARIPTVYFTDSSGACYHTTEDEFAIVNFDKLEKQASLGTALVRDLANRAAAPVFAKHDELSDAFGALLEQAAPVFGMPAPGPVAPPTYADAEQLIEVADAAFGDPALEEFPNIKQRIGAQRDALKRLPSDEGPVSDGLAIAIAANLALKALGELPCRSYR